MIVNPNPPIALAPNEDAPTPGEAEQIQRIAQATRRVVQASQRSHPVPSARRDVHPKHHGCVYGNFQIRGPQTFNDLAAAYGFSFEHGIFIPGQSYKAWIRFSNSHKRPQPDPVADGRGIAIKLLGVGALNQLRLLQDPRTQQGTQDFLLINHPAFFARHIADMVEVADLEAEDRFPSNFFINRQHLNLDRVPGLRAFTATASQRPSNPLFLEYFSQVPFSLGPDCVVKYRVRPLANDPRPYDESNAFFREDNYLYQALRRTLEEGDVQLALDIQLRCDAQEHPIDDATKVWTEASSPFIQLATLSIPTQHFDGRDRMDFAERIAFNPWNGLEAHKPLGSLNRARLGAYTASLALRYELSRAASPTYTEAEWDDYQQRPRGEPAEPPLLARVAPELGVVQLAASIAPSTLSKFANILGRSPLALAIAPALLGLICLVRFCRAPDKYYDAFTLGVDAPAIGLDLPSEDLIPPAKFADKYSGTSFERDESIRKRDVRWLFRYAPTGSELSGGLPYWLFRVLPKVCSDAFNGAGWSQFGLEEKDEQDYYTSYHKLPRGLVLSDTTVHIAGNDFGLKLKRVSFNCASCHRGEYLDEDQESQFVDGMPNLNIDTAGYKRASFHCLADPNLDTGRVLAAIDDELALERAASGVEGLSALTWFESFVYRQVIAEARRQARSKPLAWMNDRAENGLGRLDAFGALRFEFLGYDHSTDHSLATVDLPSIWNQSEHWRKYHHWDGNTTNTLARNFGAIVGVGGASYSIHREDVARIDRFIDSDLLPPAFPFEAGKQQRATDAKAGFEIYRGMCKDCHGSYTNGLLDKPTACMRQPIDVGTDPARTQAVDAKFLRDLNAFGANKGVWYSGAFRHAGQGYLCPPLDGIWLRAPYLHNGSVPTLWHLLGPPKERPETFVRGNPTYDLVHGGFVSTALNGRAAFELDTKKYGNSNQGHARLETMLVLDANERRQLIAYLLTLDTFAGASE